MTRKKSHSRSANSVNWQNPINRNSPLNKGLVSQWLAVPHWKGSTWRDLCNRYPGTLTSMDPLNDWIVTNGRGLWASLDFDGSNDYVTVTSFPSVMPAQFSFKIIIKWDASTGSLMSPLGRSSGIAWSDGFGFYANLASSNVSWFTGVYNSNFAVSSTVGTGQWYQIIGVSTLTTTHIYVNGKPGTPGTRGTVGTLGTLNIGGMLGGWGFQYTDGQIASISFYDRAIPESEAPYHYKDYLQYHQSSLNRIWTPENAGISRGVISYYHNKKRRTS